MTKRPSGVEPRPEPSSGLPRRIFLGLAVVWFLFCVRSFIRRGNLLAFGSYQAFPLWNILTEFLFVHAAGNFLRVALFWAAAWRAGAWILKRVHPAGLSRSERFLSSLGLGAGALGLTAFAFGAAGCLNGRLLVGILAVLAAAALPGLVRELRGAAWSRLKTGADTGVPLVFIAAAALYQTFVALGPTTFYDSLTYHLALPSVYLTRGAIGPMPMNAFAGIPQGIEMLYVWLLPLGGGGVACQLLSLGFGLLTCAVIVAVARRFGKTAAGVWAAAVFLANPAVLLEAGRPVVELGWSFYAALTLLALTWCEERRDARAPVLAGVFAGLALGTKFQAVLLLPAVAAYLISRFGRRDALRPAATIGAIAALLAAPWGLRNIAFYGNPVFPLLGGSLFAPSATIDLPQFLSSAHGRSVAAVFTQGAAFREFLSHPWTYSMPGDGNIDNVLSLFYLAALPMIFFLKPSENVRRLLLFAAVLWLPMNLLSGIVRFNIPALVPLSLALALGFDALPAALAPVKRAAAVLLFALSAALVHSTTDPGLWQYLNGRINEKAFLTRWHPGYFAPPFAAFNWANEHTPPGSRILLVGEPRSFYLDRDSETSSPDAVSPLIAYANDSTSGADLYGKVTRAGITHVCFNFVAARESRQVMKMSAQGLASLREFWGRSLAMVYVDASAPPDDVRGSILYRVLTPAEVDAPHAPVDVPFGAPPKPAGA